MTFWANAGRFTVWAILVGLSLFAYYKLCLAAARKEAELAEAEYQKRRLRAAIDLYQERLRQRAARANTIISDIQADHPDQVAQRGAGCEVYREDGEAA